MARLLVEKGADVNLRDSVSRVTSFSVIELSNNIHLIRFNSCYRIVTFFDVTCIMASMLLYSYSLIMMMRTIIILYNIITYNLSWLESLLLVCCVERTSFDDLSYHILPLRFIWIYSNYHCRFIILFTLALSYTAICSC